MEERLKHLELIQATIQRLASYSFAYKGWAITAVGAVLALSADRRTDASMVAALIAAAFSLLDAYYLRQERLFRCLYSSVAARQVTDMSMDTSAFAAQVPSLVRGVASPSVSVLYGTLLLVCVFAAIWR